MKNQATEKKKKKDRSTVRQTNQKPRRKTRRKTEGTLGGLEFIDHRTGVRLYNRKAILAYIETKYGSSESPGEPLGRTIGVEKLRSRLESDVRIRMDQLNWELRKRIGRVESLRENAVGVLETARGLTRIVWGNLRSAINLGGPRVSGAAEDQEGMSALG